MNVHSLFNKYGISPEFLEGYLNLVEGIQLQVHYPDECTRPRGHAEQAAYSPAPRVSQMAPISYMKVFLGDTFKDGL